MVCFVFSNNKTLKPTSRNQTNLTYTPKSGNILQKRKKKKGRTVPKLNELDSRRGPQSRLSHSLFCIES